MMKILTIIAILLMLIVEPSSQYCYSTTLYASTSKSTKSESYYYSSSEDCSTLKIRPSSYYSSGKYYLEIKWLSFDVKGNMPDCNNDYVEVFVSRSYKSIGKYCSSNLKTSNKLFPMYSFDGHAKIKFRSDGSINGKGFKFSYQLRSKSRQYLGTKDSTSCSTATSYDDSGIKFSQGWPSPYAKSSSFCTQKVYIGNSYNARVVFMDINTATSVSCGWEDYVQLLSHYSIFSMSHSTSISRRLCDTSDIRAYTVTYKYMQIEFKREEGSQSSYRGFVAGYVIYDTSKPTPGADDSYHNNATPTTKATSYGTIWSVIVVVVIIVVILTIAICICKRRAARGAIARQNQANMAIAATRNAGQPATTVMPQSVNAHPGTQYGPNTSSCTQVTYTANPTNTGYQPVPTNPPSNTYPTTNAYAITNTYPTTTTGNSTEPTAPNSQLVYPPPSYDALATNPSQGQVPYQSESLIPNGPPPSYSECVSGP